MPYDIIYNYYKNDEIESLAFLSVLQELLTVILTLYMYAI